MSLKLLRAGLGSVFFLSLASLIAVIFLINPYNANSLNLALFSGVFFLLFFSLFSWFGFYVRKRFVTEKSLNRILKMAFRQGALVSFLAVVYLWLSHFGLLKIWTILLVLLLVFGIEYYFLNLENRKWMVEGRE
ncbi:MAG: hypothetical protein Q8Q95_00930 [bacterium]|nr:hypothetical protein [bacterium]